VTDNNVGYGWVRLTDAVWHINSEAFGSLPGLQLICEYALAPGHRLDILEEHDMLDMRGARMGSCAQEAHRSIIGWAIPDECFEEEDIVRLKRMVRCRHCCSVLRDQGMTVR
jgi:hypothetical protein